MNGRGRRRLAPAAAALLALAALFAVLFLRSDWLSRWLYPIEYRDEIARSARQHRIDPYLVAAVIRVESRFRPDLRSPKGAVGLMQVMPETAAWVIRNHRLPDELLDRLDWPDVNIELGVRYLALLIDRFGGNHTAALAAYNAGPGQVDGWLRRSEWDGRLETADRIPFGETRHYVRRVYFYWEKYHSVYGNELYERPYEEPAP
ncbi:MAG: hypothetical protein BLM47_13415 [Candidatus Reconcilbacillus cellulovorans]|uniref:Transglycosylase SLT domain-containing protein n=1 Tax=Candidatus Reconcilbacillus cellulovorans TaxID=1906605 RepID=A0A2A6DX67_9BACL|nr:MAG: hypothetical protein BLM47_13415 [Candidatus Reconcilbacillus cellulovorans]